MRRRLRVAPIGLRGDGRQTPTPLAELYLYRRIAATAVRALELITGHMEQEPQETGGAREMTDAHARFATVIERLVAAKRRYVADRRRAFEDEERYYADLIEIYREWPDAMRDLNSAVASRASDMSAAAVISTVRPFADLVTAIQTLLAEMRAEISNQRETTQATLVMIRNEIKELREERREAGAELKQQADEDRAYVQAELQKIREGLS